MISEVTIIKHWPKYLSIDHYIKLLESTCCAGTCLPIRGGETGQFVERILLCWDLDKQWSWNGQKVTLRYETDKGTDRRTDRRTYRRMYVCMDRAACH